MSDSIVIDFTVDTTGLTKAIDLLEKLGQIDKKTADQFRAANREFADQQQSLKNLGAGAEKVSSGFEKAAVGAQKTGHAVKETRGEFERLEDRIRSVAERVVAVFAVERIIEFGKEAVDAFANSQKAALQLLGAVNGNEQAQKRLVDVAKEFEEKFAISRNVIISQESFLAAQGRTEKQIKKTIEAAIQLSAVTGDDLQSAIMKLDATTEGNIGRLGKLDSRFKDLSQTELENGAAIDLVLEKYSGFREKGLEGLAGSLERTKIEIEETTIKLGEQLAPLELFTKKLLSNLLVEGNFVVDLFSGFKQRNAQLQKDIQDEAEKNLEFSIASQRLALTKEFKLYENFDVEKLKQRKENNEDLLRLNATHNRQDSAETINGYQIQNLAIGELLDERQAKIDAANKKEIVTLENLKKQKADLESKLEKVQDPLTTGKKEADDLVKQIAEKERQINEITGKAAEERRKKSEEDAKKRAEALKRQLEEEAKIRKELSDKEFEQDEENLKLFIAAKKEELLKQNLDEKSLQQELTRLDLLELQLRLANYKDYGRNVGAIELSIADKKLAIQQASNKAFKEEAAKQNEGDFSRDEKNIQDFYDFKNDQARKSGKKGVELEILQTENNLAQLNEQKANLISHNMDILDIDKKLHDEEQHLLDLKAQKQEEVNKAIIDGLFSLAEIGSRAVDNYYQHELDRIDENKTAALAANDAEAKSLEDKFKRGQVGQREYEKEKEALLKKREKTEREYERKKKAEQKEAALTKALINAALAISRAFADYEYPYSLIVAALAGASAAVEVANIESYAKGVERIDGAGTETSDDIPAYLSKGERVVKASTNRKYFPMLSAIHRERFDPDSLNALSKFTPDELRQLAQVDIGLMKEITQMKPVFLQHEPPIFRKDLATELKAKHERVMYVSHETNNGLSQSDLAWENKQGVNLRDESMKKLIKGLGKEIGDQLKDPYAIHRK